MSTVTRTEFFRTLNPGRINVFDMSDRLKQELEQAGIGTRDLRQVAGEDGQIRGMQELGRLHGLIDRLDRNGSRGSFVATKQGEETRCGRLYRLLRAEVQSNHQQAGQRGIIYLGLRPRVQQGEVAALHRGNPGSQGGVHHIKGSSDDDRVGFRGRTYDLDSFVGRQQLAAALMQEGVSRQRAERFRALLDSAWRGSRSELAELGLALHRCGRGELRISRLVLSGHGDLLRLSGDDYVSLRYDNLARAATLFPHGAQKIKHLAISSCHSGYPARLDTYRAVFANLRSFFGYAGFSPSAEGLAPQHLARWERMTDGEDPSRVDPFADKSVTWNPADGYRGFSFGPLAQLEGECRDLRRISYDLIRFGVRTVDQVRHTLDRYYEKVVQLSFHPDLPADQRVPLKTHCREVLYLRHPEMRP
jgi:hypothetical protein